MSEQHEAASIEEAIKHIFECLDYYDHPHRNQNAKGLFKKMLKKAETDGVYSSQLNDWILGENGASTLILRELASHWGEYLSCSPEGYLYRGSVNTLDSANHHAKLARDMPPKKFGVLAQEGGKSYPLTVLQSNAGYYIGTVDESGIPYSQESVEYFNLEAQAKAALKFGIYYQRDAA